MEDEIYKGTKGLSTCPLPLDKDLPDISTMLRWDQEERLIGFRNDFRLHDGDVFHRGKSVFPLPKSHKPLQDVDYCLEGARYSLQDYIKRQSVRGLLFIKNGEIVYKYFSDGNNDTTLWTSRSVGKSVVSILVGIALKEGNIKSIDEKVTVYKPDLEGTSWKDVTIKHLLQHTSGVEWNEDYKDPQSDFSKLTDCETAEEPYKCVSQLIYNVAPMPDIVPGEVWSYNTGGAWLLGDILERATGKPLASYLEQKVWQPFGMARDGVWHAYIKGKHDMGGHGFNATLEDWGRFGLFVLRNGELPNGTFLLPDHWVKDSSTWNKAKKSVTEDHPDGSFGFQWWNNSIPATKESEYPDLTPISRNALWAMGIYGQFIAINPKENMVMVQWSTWKEAEPSDNTFKLEPALLFASSAYKLSNS